MMSPEQFSPVAIPQFIGGFMHGMVQDNNLTEIMSCAQGWEIMGPEIQKGIDDIKQGGWNYDVQAVLEFGLVILQIPQALDTCHQMGDDLAAIKSWGSIFTDPGTLAATISKNYLFHHDAIDSDITALTTDWDAESYFNAGEDLAQLMIDAIGPIQTTAFLQ